MVIDNNLHNNIKGKKSISAKIYLRFGLDYLQENMENYFEKHMCRCESVAGNPLLLHITFMEDLQRKQKKKSLKCFII